MAFQPFGLRYQSILFYTDLDFSLFAHVSETLMPIKHNQLLADAVFNADLALAQKHVAKATDVEQSDSMGFTLLHWAADRDAAPIIDLLLRHGANPDALDMDGLTPLHIAAGKGLSASVAVLAPVSDLTLREHRFDHTALDLAQLSAVSAPPESSSAQCVRILTDEPSRRAALAEASELDLSTSRASPSSLKSPRV